MIEQSQEGTFRVCVVGGSGFVGAAVVDALQRAGAEATIVRAPRLASSSLDAMQLIREAKNNDIIDALAEKFAGASAVVNAAGISNASDDLTEALIGANCLLPRVVREATIRAGVPRFVHVSSAGVQGRTRTLNESSAMNPFSPYTRSKALGEEALAGCTETVCFRPTSVQGAGRAVTQTLIRIARSKLASVAGKGDLPTPQVLVDNVGAAIAYVSLYPAAVPKIVLQPSEGLTTGTLLEALGGGRPPTRVPRWIARSVVSVLLSLRRVSTILSANGRRLEMMWFGQAQASGWLESVRWVGPVGIEGWRELADVD